MKIQGQNDMHYRMVRRPIQFPENLKIGEVSAIGCDSNDDIIVYSRGDAKLTRYSTNGVFVSDLTIPEMVNAHGLFIAPDDSLYCIDQVANKIFHMTKKWRIGANH